ncbi:sensor histidine kinase [Nocardiopsis sediminis]|uniref:histidine kinase n=1 Tax=Nocardiopsis sediminis TaxID=1778267 RepID=A0ABV8FS23_9ACTN
MKRLATRPTGTAADIVLAAAVGVAQILAEFPAAWFSGAPLSVPGFAFLAAGAASLAVLSRLPMLTALAVGVCTPLYYIFGQADGWAAWLMFVVAVVRLGATRHRASAITATVVVLAVIAAGETVQFEPARAFYVVGWVLVVLAAGEIARNRSAYLHEVERRAAEAERGREEEARRRATEERLRIARELHDVIAHNISLINVQAGAAAHGRDPDQAFAALDAIKRASKDTLRELRGTLGVLRQVDDAAAPLAPPASLARVGDLAAQTTEAGLPVRLREEGDAVPLPAPVDLAAYRIVQEALTNARRHAVASRAEVTVAYGPHGVSVQVDDDGRATPGAAAAPEGNGLRGMRERATALGGDFHAGPRPEGGFRVRAVLPAPADDGDRIKDPSAPS